MSSHQSNSSSPTPTRIRPMRIAAKRQQEILCAMAIQELEWHDIDEVDVDSADIQNVPDIAMSSSGTPVFSVPITPVWSENDD